MSYFTETLDETLCMLERGSANQQKQRIKDRISGDHAAAKREALKNRALNTLYVDDDEYSRDRSNYLKKHNQDFTSKEYQKKYGDRNSARINKYY